MNALTDRKRQERSMGPTLELLDERIAPSAVPAAAVAGTGESLRAEASDLARLSAEERNEVRHEEQADARADRRILASERREMALARAAARHDERQHVAVPGPSSVQVGQIISVVNLGGSSGGSVNRASTPVPGSSPTTVTPAASTPTGSSTTTAPSTQSSTGTTSSTSLPVNVPPVLATIYQEYEQYVAGGSQGSFTSSESNIVQIQGTNVGIEVHDGNPADFASLGTELQALGMQVTSSSAEYGTYVGFVPIAQLPALAQLSQSPSLSPLLQALAS